MFLFVHPRFGKFVVEQRKQLQNLDLSWIMWNALQLVGVNFAIERSNPDQPANRLVFDVALVDWKELRDLGIAQ